MPPPPPPSCATLVGFLIFVLIKRGWVSTWRKLISVRRGYIEEWRERREREREELHGSKYCERRVQRLKRTSCWSVIYVMRDICTVLRRYLMKRVAINIRLQVHQISNPLTRVYLLPRLRSFLLIMSIGNSPWKLQRFVPSYNDSFWNKKIMRKALLFISPDYFEQVLKIRSIISSSLVPETFTFSIRHAWTNRQNPSLFLGSTWRQAKRKRDITRYNSNSRATIRKFCIKSDP